MSLLSCARARPAHAEPSSAREGGDNDAVVQNGPPLGAASAGSRSPTPLDSTHQFGDARGMEGVRWRPKRDVKFGTADFVITGVAAGAILGEAIASPHERHWRGGILFDEDARDTLRLRSPRGRYFVRDMSDVGLSLLVTWPFLVDALITTWWYRGRPDVARNLTFVSLQAFAIASAVQGGANIVGSRERPYGRLCGDEIPERSVDCDGPSVRYRSFFSGHATLSFTSAGLLCANHIGLGLLGKFGDIVTCAAGVTVATTTSLFRVMSDMHYASDVGIGAIVGTAAGLAVPLLHFVPAARDPALGKVDMRLGPVGQGIGVTGTF